MQFFPPHQFDCREPIPRGGPWHNAFAKQKSIKRVGQSAGCRDPRLPAPGTVLTRRYKGRLLEVEVLAEGFEFEGRVYHTLSAEQVVVIDTDLGQSGASTDREGFQRLVMFEHRFNILTLWAHRWRSCGASTSASRCRVRRPRSSPHMSVDF